MLGVWWLLSFSGITMALFYIYNSMALFCNITFVVGTGLVQGPQLEEQFD